MEFMKLGIVDPNEFNALNHGDCWMNNLLFKMNSSGDLEDMVFVDFQNPKYGSPAMDLLYFIISSVQIDYKLSHFDFFIRHYQEALVKHLGILGFTGRKPSLRELHRTLIKYGGWVLFPTISVLPLVLLDPLSRPHSIILCRTLLMGLVSGVVCMPTNVVKNTSNAFCLGWIIEASWRSGKYIRSYILAKDEYHL